MRFSVNVLCSRNRKTLSEFNPLQYKQRQQYQAYSPFKHKKNNNLDNPSNDELPAFLTAGREQYMKIMLAIFPPLELIEHSLGERPKTLCTDEASGMKQFSVRIYNLCFRFEPVIAACTRDGIHVGCTVHFTSQGCHGVGPL